jgi:hypothetical protein
MQMKLKMRIGVVWPTGILSFWSVDSNSMSLLFIIKLSVDDVVSVNNTKLHKDGFISSPIATLLQQVARD